MTHDTFEETPLGRSFEELSKIRKEIAQILDSTQSDVFDEGPHPLSLIASVARARTETFRRIARTE